jgi:NMD protein affecting ribosome stability and mRNA decay
LELSRYLVPCARWVLVAATLLPCGPCVFAQAHASSTATHSPHGSLDVPCQNCHTAISWRPVRAVPEFDHSKTSYPLLGRHEGVACTRCHVKLVFSNTGTKCADCHADIHRRQMGADCERCHTVKGWEVTSQSLRNHHENRFPLVGGHANVECDACHKGAAVGQFQGLTTQCYSCHQTTYKQATAPNHVSAGFPTTCEQCHTVQSWLGVSFDHASVGLPLTGGHAHLQCTQCHVNNNYNLTSTACVGCHLKDYQNATTPNHLSGQFPQQCELCHGTAAWIPASFNHSFTGFPLTGAHANPAVTCVMCHVNNNYNLTSTACVSCHLKDYQGATNPNHIASGLPQQCEVCHSTSAWTPASFNHNLTTFPLTGAHTTVRCASCHVNNNYTSIPTDCYSCHKTDYRGATTPNHITAGFPTTCASCHSTTSWLGASFNHTWFNVNHGGAQGVCATCHTNPNDDTVFQCTNCHVQSRTDNQHRGVGGYVYNSINCYNCHRNGGG